jgi:hypothetical protein
VDEHWGARLRQNSNMDRISSQTTRSLTFLLVVVLVSCSFAQTLPLTITNTAVAKSEGVALVQEILLQQPNTSILLTGVLKNRCGDGERVEVPVRFETAVMKTYWLAIYEVTGRTNLAEQACASLSNQPAVMKLSVTRNGLAANQYEARLNSGAWAGWTHGEALSSGVDRMSASEGMLLPFAGSDFWVVDLGLDFFHWPEQRLIKKELCRSRSCKVLESINPNTIPKGYSRVVSWIDRETLGIVHAEAFDKNGRLLKVFDPKSFKKVDGQWELQEMEIRNVQTGSRSRIEFLTPPQ